MDGYQGKTDSIRAPIAQEPRPISEAEDRYVRARVTRIESLQAEEDRLTNEIKEKRAHLTAMTDARIEAVALREKKASESQATLESDWAAFREEQAKAVQALDDQRAGVIREQKQLQNMKHETEQSTARMESARQGLQADQERLATLEAEYAPKVARLVALQNGISSAQEALQQGQDKLRHHQEDLKAERGGSGKARDELSNEQDAIDQQRKDLTRRLAQAAIAQEERAAFDALVTSYTNLRMELDVVTTQQRDREGQLGVWERALRVRETQLSRREGLVKTAEQALAQSPTT